MRELAFSARAHEVRAILAGRQSQLRRIVKPTILVYEGDPDDPDQVWSQSDPWFGAALEGYGRCPYGQPGDRLWCREAWQAWRQTNHEGDEWEVCEGPPSAMRERYGLPHIEYRATSHSPGPWRPGIHLPRWASRITLEVTGVRVERLQAITEEDARAEGVSPDWSACDHPRYSCADVGCLGPGYRAPFTDLWRSINGAESWDANPWVWVVEFRRVAP